MCEALRVLSNLDCGGSLHPVAMIRNLLERDSFNN